MLKVDDFKPDHLWAGVFQGGGAKGVAYIGALEEMHKSKHWFAAVAGASAGALTAALIAAGYSPQEMRQETMRLLSSLRPASSVDRAIARLPILKKLTRFDASGLEDRLEQLFRVARGLPDNVQAGETPTTFAQLRESGSGIRLYVVAMDATAGPPIVFSAESTPELSVATAVVASCTIPGVFTERFLAVTPGALDPFHIDSTLPHRILDGGIWANFPSFVFTDEGFRAANNIEWNAQRVLGFTLGMTRVQLPPSHFVDVPALMRGVVDILAANRNGVGRGGDRPAIAKWQSWRKLLALLVGVLLIFWVLSTGRSGVADPRDLGVSVALSGVVVTVALLSFGKVREVLSWFSFLWPVAIVGLACFVVVASWSLPSLPMLLRVVMGVTGSIVGLVIAAGGLLAPRLARILRHEVVPVVQSLLDRSLGPSNWLDALPNHSVIFIESSGLRTTDFSASRERVDSVIDKARAGSQFQIHEAVSGRSVSLAARIEEVFGNSGATLPAEASLINKFPPHEIRPPR